MSTPACPVRHLSFAGVQKISLMMHFFHAFSTIWVFFLFHLQFPFCRLNSAFSCTVPMVEEPRGTVTLVAQGWVYSRVCLAKGFHKVLRCEISSQKWWLSCSKRVVYKEGTYSVRLPTFLRTHLPPEKSGWWQLSKYKPLICITQSSFHKYSQAMFVLFSVLSTCCLIKTNS